MNRNGLWHKSLTTRRTSCRSGWPGGFGPLNSSIHPWIFTSVPVGFRPRSCLFTSATGQISVHTAPKYATKPIRFVTLHFNFEIGTAQLCSVTEIAPLNLQFLCEQRPYLIWFNFCCRAKSIRYGVTHGAFIEGKCKGVEVGKEETRVVLFPFSRARFTRILAEFVEKTEHRTGRFANLENKNYLRVHVN